MGILTYVIQKKQIMAVVSCLLSKARKIHGLLFWGIDTDKGHFQPFLFIGFAIDVRLSRRAYNLDYGDLISIVGALFIGIKPLLLRYWVAFGLYLVPC